MKKHLIVTIICFLYTLQGFAQNKRFTLDDFYCYDSELAFKVDSIYTNLPPRARIAQMIITSAGKLGKSDAVVQTLVEKNSIGGVVFLKGSKTQHIQNIQKLNAINKKMGALPLLYSMDAEPSLLGGRIKGARDVGKTIAIRTEAQSDAVVEIINAELKEIGVQQNYAPVVDVSPNNEAIKHRSYGNNKDSVVFLAKRFITTTQKGGIIATAKHFPGHGLVKGDTHKRSVYIDGPLQEVANYQPLIDAGVLSIMIAHITINNNEKYDTEGLPSSCSRKIVTDLLKNEMQFKGLIISDALNIMKAVTILDNAPLRASKAGCDLILMPQDEEQTIQAITTEMLTDTDYASQVEQSVKKIIRMKICAGMML